jgi:hypothetical protein
MLLLAGVAFIVSLACAPVDETTKFRLLIGTTVVFSIVSVVTNLIKPKP